MANIGNFSGGFIDIALDGIENFNCITDLVGLGASRNAPDGLRIKDILFVPGADNDRFVVRDGVGGPVIFDTQAIGDFDTQTKDYIKHKRIDVFIAANEVITATENGLRVVFELS